MNFSKITDGAVTQTFNDAGECIGQEFRAGDVEYETEDGDPINSMDMPLAGREYFPFDMVQPAGLVEYVCVVTINDDVVDENYLFVGQHDDIAKRAEQKFLSLCSIYVSNWSEYSADDIDSILSEGYYKIGNRSICLNWPERD